MPLHDSSYKHWQGEHLGIWHRRLAIARQGLTASLQNKTVRHIAVGAWCSALVLVLLLFLLGQLLVPESIMTEWAAQLNPQLQMFVRLLTRWLVDHPEISVRTTQNVAFYFYTTYLLRVAIFALGLTLPLLITRDMASNAIVVYSSKAIGRGDYFVGKFCTAFGLLLLLWIGPALAAWFFANLLAPNWHFFWHSRLALFHVLLFGLAAATALSLLAMGISAITTKEKTATGIWFIWWIVGGAFVPVALNTRPWLRHLSFNFNLDELALGIFNLGNDLRLFQENVPLLGEMLKNVNEKTLQTINNPAWIGAGITLLILGIVSGVILEKKVRTE
jgi:hypothetical protein